MPDEDAPASPPDIRRVLVGLDASPHSRAALDAGARMAASIGAGLRGVFIEDESILRTARLPAAEEVRSFTRGPSEIDPDGMQRQLRYQAEQAKAILYQVAERAGVEHDFEVLEGEVTGELLRAAANADLIALGKTSGASSRRRLGATARALLSKAPTPVLVARRPIPSQRPIITYFDGSAPTEAALHMAAMLAGSSSGRALTVVLPARTADEMERLRATVSRSVEPRVPRLITRALNRPTADRLATVAHSEEGGLVVVPGTLTGHEDVNLQSFLYELDSATLVVR